MTIGKNSLLARGGGMPDKILFDGRRMSDKIQRDIPLHCGYHPIPGNGRCGRTTTEIVAFDEGRGNTWFPICDRCKPVAISQQGQGFTFHVRYREAI